MHLTRAPVTDVHGNVKYRLRVTQTERKREGDRGLGVIKEEDNETKEK